MQKCCETLEASFDGEADAAHEEEASDISGTACGMAEEHAGAKLEAVGDHADKQAAEGKGVEEAGEEVNNTLLHAQVVSVLGIMSL